MLAFMLKEGGGHAGEPHAPHSAFTWLWRIVKDTGFGKAMGFDTVERGLGFFWFDAIMFSLIASATLILCAFLATRNYTRVPRGIQNVFEWTVQLLRNLVQGVIPGRQGDKYLPYLGSLFLFIFLMNLLGLLPGGRSPTMTLSTTAALGITTFIMVQAYAIKESGVVGYLKHFMGPVLFMAPLMFVVEFIGELAKPLSLSLRLYGNISGEDTVIEQLMALGIAYYIPVQLPMILFAIFTSFLQAFIFTMLATIYIGTKVVHEEGHGEDHGHSGDAQTQGAHH